MKITAPAIVALALLPSLASAKAPEEASCTITDGFVMCPMLQACPGCKDTDISPVGFFTGHKAVFDPAMNVYLVQLAMDTDGGVIVPLIPNTSASSTHAACSTFFGEIAALRNAVPMVQGDLVGTAPGSPGVKVTHAWDDTLCLRRYTDPKQTRP